jgi:hypothetical protein
LIKYLEEKNIFTVLRIIFSSMQEFHKHYVIALGLAIEQKVLGNNMVVVIFIQSCINSVMNSKLFCIDYVDLTQRLKARSGHSASG